MQIPAGDSRQGSAEKMTDGERYTRWPVMDLPHDSNPWRKFMQDYFVGSGLSPGNLSPRGASGFAFRRILRGRHDPAGDLSHMFSGIGELTSQEL